jgi:hypothetical protein
MEKDIAYGHLPLIVLEQQHYKAKASGHRQ